MKRFIELSGFLYVVFALLIAYQSLAPFEATAEKDTQDCVAAPSHPIFYFEQLDYSDTETFNKELFTIEVWTASWCGACQKYKKIEVPKLKEMGLNVIIKDVDEEKAPEDIKKIPTVRLYYRDSLLISKVYWRADDIIECILEIE